MRIFTPSRFNLIHVFQKITDLINGIPTFIFLLILLSCNFLTKELNPNEEHYIALAKQFYNNDWMPWSFSFNDWPGERLLFQYVAGFLLSFLSFEQTAFVGKLLTFVLISYPLSLLVRKVKLLNLELFILLQLVFVFHQGFFAGEWIFGGLEPKTLAYPFIILALFFILEDKWFKTIFSLVAATYFHFLIGGWFTLIFFIYYCWRKKELKSTAKYMLTYGLLISPFFIYILIGTSSVPRELSGISYDYLLTYFRSPWHSAIFDSVQTFFYHHFKGVLMLLSSFSISFILFRFASNKEALKLNTFNLIVFSLITLFLIVGIFDKTGFFLKFLPYRTESIALLLFLIIGVKYITEELLKAKVLNYAYLLALSFTIPLFFYNSILTINKLTNTPDDYHITLYKYIDDNTNTSDVFAILGNTSVLDIYSKTGLSFSRKSRRDIFVMYKFVPYGEKIYEWYDRLQAMAKVEKDKSFIWSVKQTYKIDYLISSKPINSTGYSLVFSGENVYLYQLE